MLKKSAEGGFFLPIVLLTGLCIAILVFTVMNLSRNYRSQVNHSNKHQLVFQIAYSAYSKMLSECYSSGWENRSFKDSPHIESNVDLFGGRYDLLVHNTPGKDKNADLYIRVKFDDLTKLYFWRIEFNTDMLDLTRPFKSLWFSDIAVSNFPTAVSYPYAAEVDRLLGLRSDNRQSAAQKAATIDSIADVREIVEKLGGNPPAPPTGFSDSDQSDNFVSKRPSAIKPRSAANPPPVYPVIDTEIKEYITESQTALPDDSEWEPPVTTPSPETPNKKLIGWKWNLIDPQGNRVTKNIKGTTSYGKTEENPEGDGPVLESQGYQIINSEPIYEWY